jgi:hypothetical protein
MPGVNTSFPSALRRATAFRNVARRPLFLHPRISSAVLRPTIPSSLSIRHYAQPPSNQGGGFPLNMLMPQHQKGDALKEYVSHFFSGEWHTDEMDSPEHRLD